MLCAGKIIEDKPYENIEFTCNSCKLNIEYYQRDYHTIVPKNYCFDDAIFSYKYDGIIRKLMLDFKFKNKKHLHRFFADSLSRFISSYIEHNKIKIDYIIYVPISFIRYKERGYNQSYLIAQYISKLLGIPLLRFCLIKHKHNQRQSELKHFQRANNTKDAYKLFFGKCIQGKNILLIDDIYTTGATVNECSKVLKQGGAKYILVATSTRA